MAVLVLLGLLATGPARADPPVPREGAVMLRDAEPTIDAKQLAQVWIDPEGTATVADVSGDGRARFAPPWPTRSTSSARPPRSGCTCASTASARAARTGCSKSRCRWSTWSRSTGAWTATGGPKARATRWP
ncbi:hypothetical protein HK414_03735 [Ramlibacter terrae]|uniref:Uncharacterized protein n=1 Tax=Ramlibacter terrae TaxID=2732511 RepID=A0ABX6P0F1_9BURK|nr:hypothetical protein HK414_03735 [Ramlibacter terrae]